MIKFSKWLQLRETVGTPITFTKSAASKDIDVSGGQLFAPSDRGSGTDLQNLQNVGTEGNPMGRIDQFINNLVDHWRNFTPTVEQPSPGSGTGFNFAGDLGAALAGRKVLAYGQKPDKLGDLIISRVKQRIGNEDPHFAKGLIYMEPFKDGAGFKGVKPKDVSMSIQNTILVGPEQKVRRLAKILLMMWRMMQAGSFELPWEVEREVGELLGYPQGATNNYLKQLMGDPDDEKSLSPEDQRKRQKRRSELRVANLTRGTLDDMQSFGREMGRVSQDAERRGVQFPPPQEVDSMTPSELQDRMRQQRRR